MLAHPLAEPDKGTGIAMVCTFGDLTDVTWWRELRPADPRGASAATAGCCPTPPAGVRRRRRTRELAGQTVNQARRAIVELLREPRRPARRAAADHPPGEVLREGRPAARDRHQPPVVHPQRRPRRRPARPRCWPAGASCAGTPTHMRHRYEHWVERPHRRLADQPPALLRRAVPGLVPARRRRRAATTTDPLVPAEDRAAGRPVVATCPPGYTEDAARRARRLRRRPRRHGHLGHVVADPADRRRLGATTRTCSRGCSRWTCARRPTRSSAPGCSPRCVRAHLEHGVAAVAARGASPAGSSTPTARRCRSPRATSSRPMDLLERVRLRRGALLGGQRPARAPTPRSTTGQMKVGRRLAIKLLNASQVRARLRRGRRAPRRRSPSRSTGRMLAELAERGRRRPRAAFEALRLRPARWSAPRRSSGRSATTTSSWSRTGPTATGAGGRVGPGRAARWRCRRAAAAVRAVPAVRRPRRSGRGGRRARCTGRRGRRVRELAGDGDPAVLVGWPATRCARSAGPSRTAKLSMSAPVPLAEVLGPAAVLERLALADGDLQRGRPHRQTRPCPTAPPSWSSLRRSRTTSRAGSGCRAGS